MANIHHFIKDIPLAAVSYLGYPEIEPICSIVFIDDETDFRCDTIYIGNNKQIAKNIDKILRKQHLTIIGCGDINDVIDFRKAFYDNCSNFIGTGITPTEVYNLIIHKIEKYRMWKAQIDAAVKTQNIQVLVDTVSILAGTTVFLMNANRQVMFYTSVVILNDKLIESLVNTRRISKVDAKTFYPNQQDFFKKTDRGEYGLCTSKNVFKSDVLISVMLLFEKKYNSNDVDTLLIWLEKGLHELISFDQNRYWADSGLSVLLKDVVSKTVVSNKELEARFNDLPARMKSHKIYTIIAFKRNNLPTNNQAELFAGLEKIFPNSNIGIYGQNIVILTGTDCKVLHLYDEFDATAMETLLLHFDAHAIISTAFTYVSSMYEILILSRKALYISMAVKNDTDKRCNNFEKYASYVHMDYSLRAMESAMGHNFVGRALNPKANYLYSYDAKYKKNYCLILKTYLELNCNAKNTAEKLFMHPNTIFNKLNNIREIIDDNLDDPVLSARILWSLQAIEYYEKYRKVNVIEELVNVMASHIDR